MMIDISKLVGVENQKVDVQNLGNDGRDNVPKVGIICFVKYIGSHLYYEGDFRQAIDGVIMSMGVDM